jgi:hypothetical protein
MFVYILYVISGLEISSKGYTFYMSLLFLPRGSIKSLDLWISRNLENLNEKYVQGEVAR